MNIKLSKSSKAGKKYMVRIDNKKTIHFGAAGMSDFTKNKDPARKRAYISRHKARENWTKSGIKSAGFWAKHLLWNKPTIKESIKSIESNFNVNII